MTKTEILALLILLLSWAIGSFVYYLYLMNNDGETKFKNVKSAFFLALAFGVAAAFIGAKANISFWLVWVAYAVGGAVVTNQMLKKKDKPIPGVYGKGITAEDKEDVMVGLRNVFGAILVFVTFPLLGYSGAPWLMIFSGLILCGLMGWLYTKNISGVIRWAVIGGTAGALWYFFAL